MRNSRICILFVLLFVVSNGFTKTYTLERGSDLQAVIDIATNGDTLILTDKTYTAKPQEFTEPLCGNCAESQTEVKASYGFIIKDKALTIIGQGDENTVLVTKAGYGVYIENSYGTEIKNLKITGGVRDDEQSATDAGIVVRYARVLIENVGVIDNTNRSEDSAVVVGIGGIFGREGADITIHNCRIINNGWDGVALYRGATAFITDCIIDKGRGAGIGVTWDASCIAYRNEISGYWKGIGAFGTSWVIARNNLVHDNLGWGMIATGKSFMDMTNNVVYRNGNCGIAPWSTDSRGRIVNNIITDNGWRKQWVCPCVGVWNYGDWAKWNFSFNIVWNNQEGNYRDIWDQTDFNGNLSIDPMLDTLNGYKLLTGSPAVNAGDSTIYNLDGSRSHIGLTGGPQVIKQ